MITVQLEIAAAGAGMGDELDQVLANSLDHVGLTGPDTVPCVAVRWQIAQKLHACTELPAVGENDRFRDLVDLQLLAGLVDEHHWPDVRSACLAVFKGRGERTFTAIATQAGGVGPLPSGTLSPLLNTLLAKRALAADLPLSTKPDSKNKRYRVADPYLRFWLTFLQRAVPLIERGRGDLALERIERGWTAWRGRAVAPIIRESLLRLLPDDDWTETEAVGGWWNRQNNPEIDLVGADREPVAAAVHFVGSVTWLESRPFGRREYDSLVRDMLAVPGTAAHTPLVAVSRCGVTDGLPLAAHWGPDDLVRAWQPR